MFFVMDRPQTLTSMELLLLGLFFVFFTRKVQQFLHFVLTHHMSYTSIIYTLSMHRVIRPSVDNFESMLHSSYSDFLRVFVLYISAQL